MATMTEIKALGWDYIGLSKKSFKGAVQNYSAEGSTVTVGFTLHHAYVVEDEEGMFGVNDIREGVAPLIKAHPSEVEGTIIIAQDTGEGVEFIESELTRLGINDFETRESLENRIKHLASLDEMVDMPI